MMVLLTAYLYDGVPPAGDDSEMRERRMEFCVGWCIRLLLLGPRQNRGRGANGL